MRGLERAAVGVEMVSFAGLSIHLSSSHFPEPSYQYTSAHLFHSITTSRICFSFVPSHSLNHLLLVTPYAKSALLIYFLFHYLI